MRVPERGDIVIVTPPGTRTDYIKRVIGLPGDVVRMVDGRLIINGQPVTLQRQPPRMIPIDPNSPCGSNGDPALYDFRVRAPDGAMACRVPVVRETLPSGRSYEIVDLGRSTEDNFGPIHVPAGHLWLMGDNRDDLADSRVPEWQGGLGGPVPWENIGGRAEFLTFSLDGTTVWWNPLTWFEALPPRPRRAVAEGQLMASRKPPTAEPHVERPGPAEFRDPLVRREMAKARGLAGDGAGHRRHDCPRPAAAADRRRRHLRGVPRRRHAAARPLPSHPPAVAAAADHHPRLRLSRLGVLVRRDDHRRAGRGAAHRRYRPVRPGDGIRRALWA